MKAFAIFLILSFSLSGLALSRVSTITVSTNGNAEVTFGSMQYREQSTRNFLPGCYHYDVLQGSGWFPATFYQDIEPKTYDQGIQYEIPKRSWLARYCGAETDNVANYISIKIQIEGKTLYRGIPLKFNEEGDTEAQTNCSSDSCPQVFFSEEANLHLHVNF